MDRTAFLEFLRVYVGTLTALGDLPDSGVFYLEIDSNSLMLTCVEPAYARGFPIEFKAGRYRIGKVTCKDGMVVSQSDVSRKEFLRFKKRFSGKLRGF